MQLGLVTVVTAVLIGGFAITTAYGQAQSNTVRFSTPFETSGIPICGDKEVFLSGILNFVFHETIRPNGESAYLFSHINYQKTTAVSESGERYVWHEVQNERLTTVQNGDNELVTNLHGVVIDTGQGINGINTFVQIKTHVIIHPDGEITTEVDDVNVNCVGGDDEV